MMSRCIDTKGQSRMDVCDVCDLMAYSYARHDPIVRLDVVYMVYEMSVRQ